MTTTTAHTTCPTCSGHVCSICGHALTVIVGGPICVPCMSAAYAKAAPTLATRKVPR